MALTTGHHHHQLDREDVSEMPSSEGKSEMMAPYPAVEATPFLPSRSYRGSKSHHLQSVDKLGAFAFDGVFALADQFLCTVEFKEADMADARSDMDVGWSSGETRASEAILHDAERCSHDAKYARSVIVATKDAARQAIGERGRLPAFLQQRQGIETHSDWNAGSAALP